MTGALRSDTRHFYCHGLVTLTASDVEFLVGGAYAFERYTGIARHTKDFDVFVRRQDCRRALRILKQAGYQTEVTYPHWLAKAFCGEDFIDVIFGSGNGIAVVDDEWFAHAVPGEVLDLPVKLAPPEEIIWSKAFIMERERYDGADVAHLLHACAETLDWPRVLRRFGAHWRVILSHLILFEFIYPGERTRVPAWVMDDLLDRAGQESHEPSPPVRVCQGTLLSRAQYLPDIDRWGYEDARLQPGGNMTAEETAHWTAAIDE